MTTSTLVFDPFSDDYYNGPYATYARMRDEAPVYYSPKYDFYALTRHEDVARAFKTPEVFSSAKGVTLEEVQSGKHSHGQSIIWMDPPEHRGMRSLVNKVFTPRAVLALESMVRDTVNRYLPRLPADSFDAVADFAALFPVEVITTMLGVPENDRQKVRLWLDEALSRPSGRATQSRAGAEAVMQTGALYFDLIQQRRVAPRDDMISSLIAAEIVRDDGSVARLNDVEIAGFCTLLGGAGAETVTKLVGNALVLFAQHRDQWQQLVADRTKIPAAVEEVLRFDPPVQYDVRSTRTDITLHGTTIPADSAVLLVIGAANRDERAYPDADVFDINRDRSVAQNLGFGYGVHSCLGAALARLESRIALECLLDLMPKYEVDHANLRRVEMTSVAGYSHVPVIIRS